MNRQGDLPSWEDIAERQSFPSLLLGNGASVNVWAGFRYKSLFEIAQLGEIERSLFNKLETENFEAVLGRLFETQDVLEAANQPASWVPPLYDGIKNGLFDAVKRAHILRWSLPPTTLASIAHTLDGFSKVFTLNYDLIIYWAHMSVLRDVHMADFFWRDLMFDPTEAEPWSGVTGIYYLHGGLHLWRDLRTGRTGKHSYSNGGTAILEQVQTSLNIMASRQSLFVSGASAADKMRTIRSSDYLNFSYRTLLEAADNIVVFGASLDPTDEHIVEALSRHTNRHIAVSIYVPPAASIYYIPDEMNRIQRLLRPLSPDRIHFFNAATFPLGAPGLSVRQNLPLQ
jgi:hypothetical protein